MGVNLDGKQPTDVGVEGQQQSVALPMLLHEDWDNTEQNQTTAEVVGGGGVGERGGGIRWGQGDRTLWNQC